MAKYVPQNELSLSEQMVVRREKLEALRSEGLDQIGRASCRERV